MASLTGLAMRASRSQVVPMWRFEHRIHFRSIPREEGATGSIFRVGVGRNGAAQKMVAVLLEAQNRLARQRVGEPECDEVGGASDFDVREIAASMIASVNRHGCSAGVPPAF
ncbi:MAG: hypothetical protein ABIR80_07710, partial [Opitutaceae bacterium]